MTHSSDAINAIKAAAEALKERREEVNKLNVFPVPDGDTGTNMSLTMDSVITELNTLPPDSGTTEICAAITHGSLMGARGNSGVILSQILRGLCEVAGSAEVIDSELIATSLEKSTSVAFQAVRKPVEGTMLTVLKDSAIAARAAVEDGCDLFTTLDKVVAASFESVNRTPQLLAVLRENGVVDAGGYGLAILAEGLVASATGRAVFHDEVSGPAGDIAIELVDDWDDSEYLYCTEFLLIGSNLDQRAIENYVGGVGGSELVVGQSDLLKVHVHTNEPGTVLSHMTTLGEVAEVHVNNMRRQSSARTQMLAEDVALAEPKSIGVVSVTAGEGLTAILKSLGVDVVVSGGQTMNPSTAELVEACRSLSASKIIILPNNKNIIMAAQQAAGLLDVPAAVVPTTSVPEAFSALLAFSPEAPFDDVVSDMSAAATHVRTGEVTTAVKDATSASGPIKNGQVIGIIDHEIEVVGADLISVGLETAALLLKDGAETLTLLAGADFDDEALEPFVAVLTDRHPDVDIEVHRGEQPLYPIIMGAE